MTSLSPTTAGAPPRSAVRRLTRLQFMRMRRRGFTPIAFVALAAAASITAWLRFVPTDRDILWAEDGRNFLQDAINTGPFGSIVTPYAGYLHTIPRIIAGTTVALAPVRDYALWMTAGSCVAAGIMAAIVFVCSSAVVRWLPARVLLASLTVLLPLLPREVLGNTANLHSLALWTLLWVVLYRPRDRGGRLGLAIFALLGAMTEIQAIFLLPLVVLVDRRDRRRWLVRCALLLGMAAQLFTTVFWPRHPGRNPMIGVESLLYGYLFNSAVPVWVPQHLVGSFAATAGIGGCALLAVPFALSFVIIIRLGSRIARISAVAFVVLSMTVYVASVEDSPRPSYDYAALSSTALESASPIRYGVVPGILLCALLVVAAAVLVERSGSAHVAGRRLVRVGVTLAVGILCLALVTQFVTQTRRSRGPQWQPEVARASLLCASLPDSARVQLGETIGWHVVVPCGMIER